MILVGGEEISTRGEFTVLQRESDGGGSNMPIIAKSDGDVILAGTLGNVGIGTTSPNEKLTVAGNISACGSIYTAATTNGFVSAGRDLANIFALSSTNVDGSGTANYLSYWSDLIPWEIASPVKALVY